ncbi:MAG TPA: hypothetical protein VMY35_04775 [Phycisphaerae bacterium]|nr:hypothetical protein [Phycisphaerae bacterium]
MSVETGDTRPTFEEAFASADASPASPPETPDPASARASAETTPPPEDTATADPVPASPDDEAGPIPFTRHKEILEHTRKKLAEEWEPYAWAKTIERQQLEQAIEWSNKVKSDPKGYWAALTQEMLDNPEYGTQLRSELARALGSAKGKPDKADPEPDPDLQTEDGRAVYSADQARKLLEWRERQMAQRFESVLGERLKPFEARRQQEEAADRLRQAEADANQVYQRVSQYHGFKEHEKTIADLMVKDGSLSVDQAYVQVLHETILPSLKATDQQAVLADLQRRAAASGTNPSAAAPVTPRRPRDFYEALGVER